MRGERWTGERLPEGVGGVVVVVRAYECVCPHPVVMQRRENLIKPPKCPCHTRHGRFERHTRERFECAHNGVFSCKKARNHTHTATATTTTTRTAQPQHIRQRYNIAQHTNTLHTFFLFVSLSSHVSVSLHLSLSSNMSLSLCISRSLLTCLCLSLSSHMCLSFHLFLLIFISLLYSLTLFSLSLKKKKSKDANL